MTARPIRAPIGELVATGREAGASEIDYLLARLLDGEQTALALVDAFAPPPSLEQMFALYHSSGFLYPAKLARLAPRLAAIESTWRRLLEADQSIFRVAARHGVVDGRLALRNAISAFAYAPGTWQVQHLVSAQRHEYTGTLSVLTALIRRLHDTGADHIRLSFRPANPASGRLFGELADWLPDHLASLSLFDYGVAPIAALKLGDAGGPGIRVHALAPGEASELVAFYGRILHPVVLDSLRLDDPSLEQLVGRYAANGLARRRTILVAHAGRRLVGACLVHVASEGVNFSLLENALEHLHVVADLRADTRQVTWLALLRAAAEHVAPERDYLVALVDPRYRDLAVPAGLIARDPRQYAVITGTRRERAFLQTIDCFNQHYRSLLLGMAASQDRLS